MLLPAIASAPVIFLHISRCTNSVRLSYRMSSGTLGFEKKIDTKEKIVGVTITPGSPPEQRNRAVVTSGRLHFCSSAFPRSCSDITAFCCTERRS